MTTCKNCETSFEGKYCPNCSQKADTHRFTIGHLAHEVFHAFTHTDKGIFFLIKELFFKPGKVAEEINAGKRKKYFNPFTFLLIMMAIEIFVAKQVKIYPAYAASMETYIQELQSKSKRKQSTAELQTGYVTKTTGKIEENSKLLSFLFIPILALLTWIFFKKSGYNYAENLVFNVVINGQTLLYFLLVTVIPFLLAPNYVVLWMLLFLPVTWIYFVVAYKQFFKQRWGITILKCIAIQIIYLILISQGTKLVFDYIL